MNALQDNQRRMLAQIAEVQDALAARDKQVEELRGLVAGLESRLKVSDSEWQTRMDTLRETMSVENKQRLDAMAQRMATEMANTVQQVQQTNQGATAGEHVVRQGDVLSVIAAAYGVSLQDLMRANNLSNDRIYVGQRLKIPAPRR
jgi:LysM repeat protein